MRWAILALGALFILGGIAGAQAPAPALTSGNIDTFLRVFPAYVDFSRKLESDLEGVDVRGDYQQLFAGSRLTAEHQRFFAGQGTKFEVFADLTKRVMSAYTALIMSEQQGAMQQMAAAGPQMQQLLNNPNLTPEQKKQLQAAMPQMQQAMEQTRRAIEDVPPGDVVLVQKNRDRIEEMLEGLDE